MTIAHDLIEVGYGDICKNTTFRYKHGWIPLIENSNTKLVRDQNKVKKDSTDNAHKDDAPIETEIRNNEISSWSHKLSHPHTLLAKDENGKVVGHLIYEHNKYKGSKSLEIHDMRVVPNARKSGVGSALIDHVRYLASIQPEHHTVKVYNMINSARGFYARTGAKMQNHSSIGEWPDLVSKAISPGGRPADASHFSNSKTDNWVARAGGLPTYVLEVAHAFVRKGVPESIAIATAVNRMKEWARGGGHVRPQVQAAAAAALAEWEAKRGASHVNKVFDEMLESNGYWELTKVDPFTPEQRMGFAQNGIAMPNGSYPIPNKKYLRKAILAIGRAPDPALTKKHIVRRAKALNARYMLPSTWTDDDNQVVNKNWDKWDAEHRGGISRIRNVYHNDDLVGSIRTTPHAHTSGGDLHTAYDKSGRMIGTHANIKDAVAHIKQSMHRRIDVDLLVKNVIVRKDWTQWDQQHKGSGYGSSQTSQVKATQTALKTKGYNIGVEGVDGKFGNHTESGVKAFQKQNGLVVDGIIGPKTLALLMGTGGKNAASHVKGSRRAVGASKASNRRKAQTPAQKAAAAKLAQQQYLNSSAANQAISRADAALGRYYGFGKNDDDFVEFKIDVPISKIDEDQHLAFGWAQVANTKDGNLLKDKQGDFIDEIGELEKAAYGFVLDSRDAGEMHIRKGVGTLVESMMFTPEKKAALGLPDNVLPDGWFVGYKVDDPDVWAKVKDGTYPMFSVGGIGQRKHVEGVDD